MSRDFSNFSERQRRHIVSRESNIPAKILKTQNSESDERNNKNISSVLNSTQLLDEPASPNNSNEQNAGQYDCDNDEVGLFPLSLWNDFLQNISSYG